MKFKEPSNWPIQNSAIEIIHRTTPNLGRTPRTDRIQWSVLVQPPASAIVNEERRDQNEESSECDQNDIMLNRGNGISSARPESAEVIAKRGERRGRQYEKDHDRAMHGHQLQIIFGVSTPPARRWGQRMEPGNRSIRPSEVDAHYPGSTMPIRAAANASAYTACRSPYVQLKTCFRTNLSERGAGPLADVSCIYAHLK